MADRRRAPKPSKADAVLLARIKALEAALEQHKADSERAIKAVLEQIASIPGVRGSMPPQKT